MQRRKNEEDEEEKNEEGNQEEKEETINQGTDDRYFKTGKETSALPRYNDAVEKTRIQVPPQRS